MSIHQDSDSEPDNIHDLFEPEEYESGEWSSDSEDSDPEDVEDYVFEHRPLQIQTGLWQIKDYRNFFKLVHANLPSKMKSGDQETMDQATAWIKFLFYVISETDWNATTYLENALYYLDYIERFALSHNSDQIESYVLNYCKPLNKFTRNNSVTELLLYSRDPSDHNIYQWSKRGSTDRYLLHEWGGQPLPQNLATKSALGIFCFDKLPHTEITFILDSHEVFDYGYPVGDAMSLSALQSPAHYLCVKEEVLTTWTIYYPFARDEAPSTICIRIEFAITTQWPVTFVYKTTFYEQDGVTPLAAQKIGRGYLIRKLFRPIPFYNGTHFLVQCLKRPERDLLMEGLPRIRGGLA